MSHRPGPVCNNPGCPCAEPGTVCHEFVECHNEYCIRCGWEQHDHKEQVTTLPTMQGAVISYRGKVGFAWLGVRGGEAWFLTRRDAWEQDMRWREATDAEVLEEVGSELDVLHWGGYDRPAPTPGHPHNDQHETYSDGETLYCQDCDHQEEACQ